MNQEFSRRDRVLYILTYVWTFAWVAVFAIGTIYFLTRGVSDAGWRTYNVAWMRHWRVYLWISVDIGGSVRRRRVVLGGRNEEPDGHAVAAREHDAR